MRTRGEAVKLIEAQLGYALEPLAAEKRGRVHYGVVELRQLMDFIYGGPPASPEESIAPDTHRKSRR